MTDPDRHRGITEVLARSKEGRGLLGDFEQLSLERRRVELGWVGRVFGSDIHAASNITGVVVLGCLVVVVGLLLLPLRNDVPRSDVITALIGVIVAALGYLWGRRAG